MSSHIDQILDLKNVIIMQRKSIAKLRAQIKAVKSCHRHLPTVRSETDKFGKHKRIFTGMDEDDTGEYLLRTDVLKALEQGDARK